MPDIVTIKLSPEDAQTILNAGRASWKAMSPQGRIAMANAYATCKKIALAKECSEPSVQADMAMWACLMEMLMQQRVYVREFHRELAKHV